MTSSYELSQQFNLSSTFENLKLSTSYQTVCVHGIAEMFALVTIRTLTILNSMIITVREKDFKLDCSKSYSFFPYALVGRYLVYIK